MESEGGLSSLTSANLGTEVNGEVGSENHTSIRINNEDEESTNNLLATSLKEMDKLTDIPLECCIYRVPPTIRALNEKVYTLQVVSIGPFHHDKKELKGMEKHKLRCMKAFLGSTTTSLDDFITMIKGFEMRARNYYAEKINLSVNEFVKILMVDSFFILESMLACLTDHPCQASYLPMNVFLFLTDTILLENQIPFFEKSELFRKVVDYLNLGHELKHFVDLLRICHLPLALRTPMANIGELISIPNAVQLQEAGIQLLKLGTSDSLLEIKFTEGVLEIPLLVLQEYYEIVLSNILVLENCHYIWDSYIRDYVFFMQMLVDTAKDADLLIQNKIIEDWTGESSTVAALFNKIGNNVLISSSSYYFYDISNVLNAYCNITRHKWNAIFKRDYCGTPWMIASTIAAIILLFLTLLSTISSFLAL
ncbi:hypothetical protein LguiB_027608 [Lonicera macranthoides]